MPEQYNTNGWNYSPEEIDLVYSALQNGSFAQAAPLLKGEGVGKTALLHEAFAKIGMAYPVLNQLNYPTCAAFTGAGGVDLLKAVEIASGEREEFKGLTASEPLYFGARKLSGWRIRGGGASVAMIAKYIAEYGVLLRQKYPNNIDLTEYNGDKAVRWGNNSGFPKTLEDISKDHVVREYSRIDSWESYQDSIYAGFPVLVGSNFGFESATDDLGFCKPSGEWNHAMLHIATRQDRPGGLIANSWGKGWLKIKKKNLNQPDGSFWCDAKYIDSMCKNGDAWNIAGFNGWKKIIDSSVGW